MPENNTMGDVGVQSISDFLINSNENFVGNAGTSLRYDEWKAIDEQLVATQLQWMAGIADLYEYSLDTNNGGLGTIIHEYETVSGLGEADVDMTGEGAGSNDKPKYGIDGVPVPLVHKKIDINKRKLEASRKRGEAIDTTIVAESAKVIAEKQESMLFNGHATKVDGKSIYGYTTHPSKNDVTLALNWGTTPANIEADFRALLAAADAVNRKGPFIIYVSKTEWSYLRKNISTTGDSVKTYYQAMKEMFAEIIDIKVSYALATGNVVMVQMDKGTVDLSISQEMTRLEMESKFFQIKLMVFQAMIHRIKVDGDGTTGVFHGTAA